MNTLMGDAENRGARPGDGGRGPQRLACPLELGSKGERREPCL
jgi:hypothetical protein